MFQCLRKKSLRDYSIFRSIIMRLLTNTPIHSLTTLKQFQEIDNNLKRYDFIIIDKFNDVDFMKIRKNFNNILMK